MIYLSLALIIIAGWAKARMDLLAHGKVNGYDPDTEWKKKWKNGDESQGEAFKFSSTYLVFLTDRWHFMQFIFLNSLFVSVLPYVEWWKIIIARIAFGLGFKTFYEWVK